MSESRTILVNGATYHTARHGPAQGPALLLLHGFTGSSRSWQNQIPAFARHFSVLTVDILGHGRSASPPDPTRYTMPQVAADMIAVLDAWQVERTALLGYSMGGRLALYLACHYATHFTHLILESSSPGLADPAERAARRQRDDTLADWLESNGLEAFVQRWESLPLWASQKNLTAEVKERLRQQRLQNSPQGLANSLRGMGTGAQPSLWPMLPKITLPTLLMVGEVDEKFVGINQVMATKLPNGRLQIIPDAGHTVHLEQPVAFQTAVLQFLRQADVAI